MSKYYICIYDEDDMQYTPAPDMVDNELIQCRDCKHYECITLSGGGMIQLCGLDPHASIRTQLDGYCWRSKRKEE